MGPRVAASTTETGGRKPVVDRFTHWLHVRGVIRTASMASHSLDPTLIVRIESRCRVPKRAVAWFARRYLLHMRPSAGRTHYLARVDRSGVTLAKKRQWELTYLPAPTTTSRPRSRRVLDRRQADA